MWETWFGGKEGASICRYGVSGQLLAVLKQERTIEVHDH